MAYPLMLRERFLLAVATATTGAVTPSFGADAPNDPVCVYARNSCAIDVIERRFALLVSDRAATTDQSAGGISLSLSLRVEKGCSHVRETVASSFAASFDSYNFVGNFVEIC